MLTSNVYKTETIMEIDTYVDSDWAGCALTRKSTSGFIIKILGCAVSYASRTQATLALSSAEAELYAIGTGCCEGLAVMNFLNEIGLFKKVLLRMHTDNSAGKT